MFRQIRWSLVAGFALATIACQETREPTASSGSRSLQASLELASAGSRYLPYGVPVPPGLELTALPEPYDLQKHGPGMPNDRSQWNLVGTSRFPSLPPRGAKLAPPSGPQGEDRPTPGTGDRGLYLTDSQQLFYGIYQVNDVQLDMQLPLPFAGTAADLYAPTVMPPKFPCIEATTVHQRIIQRDTTDHYMGWFDWCSSPADWKVFEAMDDSFQAAYVRTYNGEPTLVISIVRPVSGQNPPCWYGHLYNYTVGGWVQKWSSCGMGGDIEGRGWTMWETYNLLRSSPLNCPSIPSIRAMDIQFAVRNPDWSLTWRPISDYPADVSRLPASGDWPCWYENIYTFSYPVPGLSANSWRANTPNP